MSIRTPNTVIQTIINFIIYALRRGSFAICYPIRVRHEKIYCALGEASERIEDPVLELKTGQNVEATWQQKCLWARAGARDAEEGSLPSSQYFKPVVSCLLHLSICRDCVRGEGELARRSLPLTFVVLKLPVSTESIEVGIPGSSQGAAGEGKTRPSARLYKVPKRRPSA